MFLYLKIKNDIEKYQSMSVNTIDSVTKYECHLLIDTLLLYINSTYNKQLVRGEIDRVEKTINEDSINYKINIFIYNAKKYTTKKIMFDISYNNNNIIINNISDGISRDILVEERNAYASRGSVLFKPRVNIDNVEPNSTLKNNHSNINYNSTVKPQDDKNKWILPIDAPVIELPKNKPLLWDSFGISNDNSKKCQDKSLIQPKFIVSNFTQRNDVYDWLFDPAQDSSSRPIGT